MSKKRVVALIMLGVLLFGCGYYFGYSTSDSDNKLNPTDFNGTFSEQELITNTVESDYIYISISSEMKQYAIFYVGSRTVISKGECQIDDNIAILNDDVMSSTLVYTHGNFYWINSSGEKQKVYKVNSAPVEP